MRKNLKKFGQNLKNARIARNLSLREICKKINYDASNWSKIERGIISPPHDKTTLSKWAEALQLSTTETERFIDQAVIAKGQIPKDLLSDKKIVKLLPAFFRTLRNERPTDKEVDNMIEMIKDAHS